MKIRCGSLGQDGIPHVDNQTEDLLVDRVRVCRCRFESLSRFAFQLCISNGCRKFNLGNALASATCKLVGN